MSNRRSIFKRPQTKPLDLQQQEVHRKHQDNFVELAKIKKQIARHNLKHFIQDAEAVDEDKAQQLPSLLLHHYSKMAYLGNAVDVVNAYTVLEADLLSWGGAELKAKASLYPQKEFTHQLRALNKKVADVNSGLQDYQAQLITDFSEKLGATIAELRAEHERLKNQKETHHANPRFLNEAYQRIIDHYAARLKHMELAQEKFNAHFVEAEDTKKGLGTYSMEELLNRVDDVIVQEKKHILYNGTQQEHLSELEETLKLAIEDAKVYKDLMREWRISSSLFTSQSILNNNFMAAFEPKDQHTLEQHWKIIEMERLAIHGHMEKNKKDQVHSIESSNEALKRLRTLKADYSDFKMAWAEAEKKRRKQSEVNRIISNLINVVAEEIKSKHMNSDTKADWEKWKENAVKWQDAYVDLHLLSKEYLRNVESLSPERAAHMEKTFSTKGIDEIYAKCILDVKLSPKQYKELASNHNLSTFSGRFNHAMHKLFMQLEKFFKAKDEFFSAYFAAPGAEKARHWTAELEKHRPKPPGPGSAAAA